jgi:hypothetical protein
LRDKGSIREEKGIYNREEVIKRREQEKAE